MKVLDHKNVIPVLVIEDSSWAKDLAITLLDAGLPVVEVTLRTPQSWMAVEAMREVPGLTLGIGSVTTVSDLRRGKEIGIDFAVSAGLRRDLVEGAREASMPYLPGVATPSEILSAIEIGVNTVKWFPAETLGGISALKAISAPFPSMNFVPTGGITGSNAETYLSEKRVRAVGGSWMFTKEAMSSKDLAKINEAARLAATISKPRDLES